MIVRIRIVAMLTLVWMALWESVALGTALAGIAVSILALRIVPPRSVEDANQVRPVAALMLFGYFVRKLIQATLLVAWEVVTPRNRINEGIVAVPMVGASDGLVTLAANMVSLTPGTLTLEVRRDPPTLYVHVLHLRSVEEVRLDVQEFEQRAIAAFGPAPEERGS